MSKNVYVVSNSHIDPVWLWNKYEGIDEVINTFRAACERLDENPDLYFSASSITFYKWVEELAPDVFERIKKHIAGGQWEIAGAWLVEADCNLPLSESFIKSAQISRAYIKEKFNVGSEVAYSPDTFGHPASLPETLVDTGFKYYLFCRPSEHEKSDLPSDLFYWEHNGKRVLCYRLKYHYTQGRNMTLEDIEAKLDNESFYVNDLGCLFVGVGDHGGGPTKREIGIIKELREKRPDLNIRFSTLIDFFKTAEQLDNIPVVTGDLHNHAIGCYSVNREIKNNIRKAERSLCYTQRILDDTNNKDISLDREWETTIFNEFHDILPGSCSPEAAKQAIHEVSGVLDTLDNISYRGTKELSRLIPVSNVQGEFRIYNSLGFPVKAPLSIESFMYYKDGAPLKRADGTIVPIQRVTPSVFCANIRGLFIDEIPAKTMARYYFDSEDTNNFTEHKSFFYESGDYVSCGNKSIYNLNIESGTETFFSRGLELEVLKDKSDTWSHGIPAYNYGIYGHFKEESTSVHFGDIASFLISRQKYGKSEAEFVFTVYKDMPFVDLTLNIRWLEEHSVLKLNISPRNAFDTLLAQGPGAAIEKKCTGNEEPMHGWLLCGNLGVCQDGAFAFDSKNNHVSVTLVRSNLYGWDITSTVDRLGPLNHTDLGEHSFKFRFFLDKDLTEDKMEENLATFIEPFNVIRENQSS